MSAVDTSTLITDDINKSVKYFKSHRPFKKQLVNQIVEIGSCHLIVRFFSTASFSSVSGRAREI